ncbi:MAG TPA: hypothetical protein PKH94_06165 [Bacteroidales bacterium]|nr:hypothetical protein [Bacteroidales bacterium]HNS46804.1 hypothetical protein [Bacteroidales bacterium]
MPPFRYILLWFCLLATSIPLFAQGPAGNPSRSPNQPIRLEIETRQDSEPFTVIPFGSHGMLLFYESVVATDDKDHTVWIFKLYDVNFRQLWIQEMPVLKDLKYKKFHHSGNYLYLLYCNDEKAFDGNNVEILKVPGNEGLITAKTCKIPDKSLLAHFAVWNRNALLGIITDDDRSSIILFDLETAEQRSVTVTEAPFNFLLDMKVDSLAGIIHTFYKAYDKDAREFLFYKQFDEQGDSLLTVTVTNDAAKYLVNSGEILNSGDQNILIIGTYKDNPKGKVDAYYSGLDIESSGLFVTRLNGRVQEFMKYYNFSEFDGFYKNLSVNDLSRIRKRDKKGQDITIDYNLLVHNVIRLEDGYVFVAEAYYPEYHTVTRMMYDWYGRPMPSYYNVFDGYRYTSAFITRFDREGNMLWDNGMELWNILSDKLENRVNVIFDGEETILAFNHEGEITYKVFTATAEQQNLEYVPIESKHTRDRAASESGSNMLYWYKNYFLVYGYQRIRNTMLSSEDKRNVFYVNKIAFN